MSAGTGPDPALDNLPQSITIEETQTGNVFQVQTSHEHNMPPLTTYNWHDGTQDIDHQNRAVPLTFTATESTGTFGIDRLGKLNLLYENF